MKRVIIEGKPHLFLFALREILPGEEITYDYGGKDWPWRKQAEEQSDDAESSTTAVFSAVLETSERPTSPITQAEEQSDDAESSTTAVFNAVLETSERPTSPITQALDEPDFVVSTKKVPCLVDYSDSDESQGPCTNPCSSQIQSQIFESDPILTDQDRQSIPQLRTKSIQMKERIYFDSDELFDPISDDSGEEYIPKSTEDSSEDSDGTNIVSFDHKMKMQRFPNMGKIVDVRDGCLSMQELDKNSLNPTIERGRSHIRKKGTSGKRRQRNCSSSVTSPRTQTSTVNSTKQSEGGYTEALLVNSAPDLVPNLPDGASSLVEVTIPAVCKKEDGSRMYNKKQYCLYCKKGFIKMARHLECAHKDKPEVERAVSFPKGSKERRMHMELLRNRGNFAHNVEVVNSGVGTPVPRKHMPWKHMKVCKFKPSTPLKPGRTCVQALCGFAVPPPPSVKEQLWKLLNNMVQDDVYFAVKTDACLMEYGEHLYNRLGYDVSKHEYIRQKLRELGRLLIFSRKNTHLKTIKDHIKPANFMQVVQAVRDLAGYNCETNAYKCPSLALKIGYSLKKISMLVESRANVQSDFSTAKDARTFRKVYEARWNEMISSASLRTLQESKWNTPQLLPFTKDVQTLHSYLDAQ
nr:uncharacterized protein LOC122776179 [Solea senegalensis]